MSTAVSNVSFFKEGRFIETTGVVSQVLQDEIHIKPCLSYQSGQLFGAADNQKEKVATQSQAFMISSIKSKNKDVVSLVPVAKMTGQYLYEPLQNVIINITNAGFIVNSVISDNNVINRSAFKLLAGADTLQPYFLNPVNKSRVYIILFDSVHIMKCIRNKWLNVKSIDRNSHFLTWRIQLYYIKHLLRCLINCMNLKKGQ